MEIEAARMIGVGLSALGFIGSGIGMGILFGMFFSAAARNPQAAERYQTFVYIGLAMVESIALFALVFGLIMLFA